MPLTSELISQFVKVTKDNTKVKKETTLYGTIVYDGRLYVKLDGSDLLTPISTTTNIQDGERVTVMIKDHTATVTGNISSPSARTEEVEHVASQVTEFGSVVAHKITVDDIQAANVIIDQLTAITGKYQELEAVTAEIEQLKADLIEGETLKATDIEAITAKIESIEAKFGEFTNIQTEDLGAIYAEITNLKGYTADFTYVSAIEALVKKLDADKVSTEDLTAVKAALRQLITEEADIKYADIDFANITEAAINKFYSLSGIIDRVEISEGVFTKELVGVTISGNLLKANTLMVDQLVVRGSDGNYYKLSTDFSTLPNVTPIEEDLIHGSNIVANSITAEKISVDDISAFGGRIGGFGLTHKSLHSLAKDSVENSNPGVYMDSDSQFAVGDMHSYIKFYKVLDADGYDVLDDDGNPTYKLAISADSILFGSDSKTALSDVKALTEHVKIGTIIDDESGDEKPCIELAESDSDFKQVITNVKTLFMDGSIPKTTIDSDGVETDNLRVKSEFKHAGFVWAGRTNGNYGLSWKG